MIDPAAKLSVSRQALEPGISRGGVYCHPRPVSEADLKLMRRVLADERLWRTLKYDGVYPQACTGVPEARVSIGRYLGFRNGRRPHSSLDGQTPDQTCFSTLTPDPAAV